MTYLGLSSMLASKANGDSIPLAQQKLAILFRKYGVTEAAQQTAPGKLVVKMLANQNKIQALEVVTREIFKAAGVPYPIFTTKDEIEEFGRILMQGLRGEK